MLCVGYRAKDGRFELWGQGQKDAGKAWEQDIRVSCQGPVETSWFRVWGSLPLNSTTPKAYKFQAQNSLNPKP